MEEEKDFYNKPAEDIAKDGVLIIEQATIEIKKAIVSSLRKGTPKEELNKQLQEIVNKYSVELEINEALKKKFDNNIKANIQRWHRFYSENIKTLNMETAKRLERVGISIPDIAALTRSDKNQFRPFVTNNKKGLAIIDNYEQRVKNELVKLINDNPTSTIIDKNGVPRRLNLRNQAETIVRLEANKDTVKELSTKENKFVVTTSHADCSPRCEPWQGRLYSLDGTSGKKDGMDYVPLEIAMEGENKDGNGIITGYNCRHRIVPYEKGMTKPVEYSQAEIRKERKIDSKQRYYERNIRRQKTQETLFREQGLLKEAQATRKLWQKNTLRYEVFSHNNGRAFYRWRTRINTEERHQNIATNQKVAQLKN